MNIDIYLREGIFVDSKNMPISGEPFLTADTVCTVTLGIFANASATTIENITTHSSWECVINDAYGAGNTAKIRVVGTSIIGGKAVITFSPLGSAELRESLGDLPAKRYTFELNGFTDSTDPDFTLQFPVIIRNRIGTGAVDPEPAAGYIVYPDGGTVGQVLTKTSTGAEWADGGGGGGGAVDSVNGKTGAVTLDASDVGAVESPAAEGSVGQVLTKTAEGTGWTTPPQISLAACSGLGLSQTGSGPAFSWTDPDNVTLNGATLAAWSRTVLVRKVGEYPANPQDGTILAETSAALGNKNYYRDHSYTDETQEEGSTYYYKLFSQTSVGDWNDLTANEYTDGTGLSWGQVRQYVRDGRGPELFPVGTVFTVDHAEYSHPNGDGLYFRVVGHDQVPAQDENIQHTMCLEMTDCLFSAPYDAAELEYALTWDTTAQTGKTYYTYDGSAYTALTEGTDWNPGDPVPAAEWYEKNVAGRNSYGSNNPLWSNALQWLNSTGGANVWYKQKSPWDLCGDMRKLNGFLVGIDREFLSVVTAAKLTTARSTGDGGSFGNDPFEFTARFWFPSRTQVNGAQNGGITENAQFQFYADGGSSNKKDFNGTAIFWWLRSPVWNDGGNVCCTNTSGGIIAGVNAKTVNGYSPACIIG